MSNRSENHTTPKTHGTNTTLLSYVKRHQTDVDKLYDLGQEIQLGVLAVVLAGRHAPYLITCERWEFIYVGPNIFHLCMRWRLRTGRRGGQTQDLPLLLPLAPTKAAMIQVISQVLLIFTDLR